MLFNYILFIFFLLFLCCFYCLFFFFFSSRRRHTRSDRDWSSDVCSSDLQAFPWLVHSEVLHYGYALIMLVGIWMLLPGFVGRSRAWWLAALVIQFWHQIGRASCRERV